MFILLFLFKKILQAKFALREIKLVEWAHFTVLADSYKPIELGRLKSHLQSIHFGSCIPKFRHTGQKEQGMARVIYTTKMCLICFNVDYRLPPTPFSRLNQFGPLQ